MKETINPINYKKVKMDVFWGVSLYSLIDTDNSEGLTASIIRVAVHINGMTDKRSRFHKAENSCNGNTTSANSLFITMMMEAVSSFEMSVNIYQTTECNIPKDSHLYTHCHENLKSHLQTSD
jgi:hypothetical protein